MAFSYYRAVLAADKSLRGPVKGGMIVSPLEWLVTATGTIPQARNKRTSEICTATQIGVLKYRSRLCACYGLGESFLSLLPAIRVERLPPLTVRASNPSPTAIMPPLTGPRRLLSAASTAR
jgi:hypothetical protein